MEEWREQALAEINGLKPYWVQKHGWQPEVVQGEEMLDLFVALHARRFDGKLFVLRLRYLPDWQVSGRREAFVDADDHSHAGTEFWPPEGGGINPNYQHQGAHVPVICLRGVWGFHSVLHTDRAMDGASLLRLLMELQGVLDR